MEFSIRGMKNIIKNQTAKRVSEDAKKELREELEEVTEEIAEEAIQIAQDKGRKTVRQEDIKEALKSRDYLLRTDEIN